MAQRRTKGQRKAEIDKMLKEGKWWLDPRNRNGNHHDSKLRGLKGILK